MALHDDLDHYQIADLCAGPQRVALLALVALCQDGKIKISPARHRVSVVTREPGNPVERAVMEAVPDAGRVLGPTMKAVAGSPEVAKVRSALVEPGLLRRWRRTGRTRRGRAARHLLLREEGPTGLRAVAILGPAGITDAMLHRIFTTPDPAPLPKLRHGSRGAGLGGGQGSGHGNSVSSYCGEGGSGSGSGD